MTNTAESHMNVTGRVARHVPIVAWLPSYQRRWLTRDAVAAISVWALLVPQSLGYAGLAGVPLQYGLYTAFAALVAYAIFGASRQVVQGPSGAVAAVSAAVVLPLVGASAMGTEDAVPFTAALALTAGLVYLLFGALRLGWVSNFLSRAVMSGFVLGFSIGIIIDQSDSLLGVPATDGSYWQQLVSTVQEIPDTNGATLVVGAVSLVTLLLMRWLLPRWPRALLVVALSLVAVPVFDLTDHGVAVTGDVPTGLFTVSIPTDVWSQFGALLIGALSIVFVGYSETLAAGRAMAAKNGTRLDADQELVAEGMACAGAGLVGGFANDGSLSKTSVADAAGQKSQMASVINALLVLVTMLFLAGIFENLPSAVLGAVVIDAMVGLLDFAPVRRYYRVNRWDFLFCVAAGLGIIFFSITEGILIGVILSLLLLIGRASTPAIRTLGREPDSDTYLDVTRHAGLLTDPSVLVVRIDGPLFFANVNRFGDTVHELRTRQGERVKAVVVDMEAVAHTDTDGADKLMALAEELAADGVWFGIARVESSVMDQWRRAGAVDAIGEDRFFNSVREAADAALSRR